jgi:predicted transcriptional regulator
MGIRAALDAFKRAMRFRRKLNRALRPLQISFAEWRVLEATSRLFRQSGDAVSHLHVSRDLDLGESSVSRLMWNLSRRDLLSHDMDAWGLFLRVLITEEGERLVVEAGDLAAQLASRAA